MTRRLAAVLPVILFFAANVSLGATGVNQPDEAAGRIVTDALGRNVTIPANPQRLVLAGRANLMVADAFYAFDTAADRVVGITRIGQARGNFLPEIDSNFGEKTVLERNVGPEQIAALNPDIVILKSFLKEQLGDGIEGIGIPVVYLDLETPEQYTRDLTVIGEILQEPTRAAQISRYYADAVDAVSSRTREIPEDERPSVLFLYANPTGTEVVFNVAPESWIQTTMVELAGGRAIWKNANPGSGWLSVSFEQIAAWDPDQIFLVSYRNNPDEVRSDLLEQDAWNALSAVRNGEFYTFPADFYSWDQPDTRWALGLQWLATKVQPDLFADIEMTQVVYAFFDLLYSMDRGETDEIILADLWGDFD